MGKTEIVPRWKVALPYSGFLGYDKGENGELVVNDKEALVIRRIYRQVLQGLSSGSIARLLTADGIATPRGLTKWSNSVVKSIRITVDFGSFAISAFRFSSALSFSLSHTRS